MMNAHPTRPEQPSPTSRPEGASGPFHDRPEFPYPDPEWWRCRRLGPVSGRYAGQMTAPTAGRYTLELRVDIDPRYANSPVLNCISGDISQLFRFNLFGYSREWRVYKGSWIVESPTVKWSQCQVEITGTVRFWKGAHPTTHVRVVIPWGTFTAAGPAEVTFSEVGGSVSSYSCVRKSDCFRELNLEVAVCASVNTEPTLPGYDTLSHATRPADLPQRTLTIEEVYREAGICVSISPERVVIDDSVEEFETWTDSQLHDAMETHFTQYPGRWPQWEMWGLSAGNYERSTVAGIMFDYRGTRRPPERQGFAVFRGHRTFRHLVEQPTTEAQAATMRYLLYVWVHEAGHAFNYMHSWDKGRPEALSWMNYPQRVTEFWANFEFRFDDEELLHLRHGDRMAVIPGGDPWASGRHLEAPSGAMVHMEGDAPIELLLRSKEYFEFLEPVVIEFRLRNLMDDLAIPLDTRLSPEYGGVMVYIRRPDGRILEYASILCKLGDPEIHTLKSLKDAVRGEDRYSKDVFLSYGNYGFYFDEPGEYLIRAVYQGAGDILIPSNLHRVRVGNPTSKEEDRIAQDYFSHEVGMNLYLGGSRSPFLEKGTAMLEEIADRYKTTVLGAEAATTLARSLVNPFFRVQEQALKKTHNPDPERALALTEAALRMYKRVKDQGLQRALNIPYHHLVRQRAQTLQALGQEAQAKKELAALRKDLASRGVNEPVLKDIKTYEESL